MSQAGSISLSRHIQLHWRFLPHRSFEGSARIVCNHPMKDEISSNLRPWAVVQFSISYHKGKKHESQSANEHAETVLPHCKSPHSFDRDKLVWKRRNDHLRQQVHVLCRCRNRVWCVPMLYIYSTLDRNSSYHLFLNLFLNPSPQPSPHCYRFNSLSMAGSKGRSRTAKPSNPPKEPSKPRQPSKASISAQNKTPCDPSPSALASTVGSSRTPSG